MPDATETPKAYANKFVMRALAPLMLIGIGFLAGCAAPNTGVSQAQAPQNAYSGRVVALNQESSSAATGQIVQLLGWSAQVPQTGGEEIVVRLDDGEVKSFVPRPGMVPANLTVGSTVMVTETPTMQIIVR